MPLLHTWSSADPNVCGATPMSCPLRDGTTVTLGAADCAHEPLRAAIAGLGPGSQVAQPARLREPGRPAGQLRHPRGHQQGRRRTPTPPQPADYNGAILDWVHARLGD